MRPWTAELEHALLAAVTAQDAATLICRAALRLGFEHFAYGLRWPVPFTRPRTLMVSSYPPAWQRRYHEAGYLEEDPTVAHGLCSHAPALWSDKLFRGAPGLWEEARCAGLRVGWCQSCFDADGSAGLFTVARATTPIGRAELSASDPVLRWLTNVVHLTLGTLLRRREGLEVPALTERQLEVLRWSADGKTTGEVAHILGLSPDTVKFHLQGSMARLGARNKTALIARAAKQGLLS